MHVIFASYMLAWVCARFPNLKWLLKLVPTYSMILCKLVCECACFHFLDIISLCISFVCMHCIWVCMCMCVLLKTKCWGKGVILLLHMHEHAYVFLSACLFRAFFSVFLCACLFSRILLHWKSSKKVRFVWIKNANYRGFGFEPTCCASRRALGSSYWHRILNMLLIRPSNWHLHRILRMPLQTGITGHGHGSRGIYFSNVS